VVIEHNLDVIKTADRIIDMGPEGGEEGGQLIGAGTPEEIAAIAESYTGHFLTGIVEPRERARRAPRRQKVATAA
jgi:excinuclease ABC subunit A